MTNAIIGSSKKEKGIALFMAIFALMLLSAIAAGFMFMANTETAVNKNYKASQAAYFAARAGLQEARTRLRTPAGDLNGPANLLKMPTAGVTTGGIYIVNPNATDGAIQPWAANSAYFDDTLCKANFPGMAMNYGVQALHCDPNIAGQAPGAQWTGATVPSQDPNTGTDAATPYKWVRITLKSNLAGSPLCSAGNPNCAAGTYPFAVDQAQAVANAADNRRVCWTGTSQVLLPAGYADCKTPPLGGDAYRPVFLLTSYANVGVPGTSGAERTLSMEVADDPPLIVKGAVVSNDLIDAKGSSAGFIGQDNCNCKCTTAGVCTDRASGGTCTSGYNAITTSQTVNTSGGPTVTSPLPMPSPKPAGCTVAGQDACAESQNVNPFPYDVNSLISRFKNQSTTLNASGPPYNLSCSGSPVSCGSVNGGSWGTVPTNFTTLQTDGTPVGNANQTTYVGGNLDLYAHNSGSGILVVDGDLTVHGGISFYGLIIVKGAITFTGGGAGGGSNIIGAVLAGQSAQADTLGGSAQFQFDSCALANAQTGQAPHVLSTREIEY
jgi:Tfp pilus assembly protein PilX